MPLYFAHSQQDILGHNVPSFLDDDAGGQVTFIGTVRKFNHGKDVLHLDYEAHEKLATSLFADLELDAQKRFDIKNSHACHRLGRVHIGEHAVIIHAQARHRHEAFLGARFLIDELKKTLPIWRKEVYTDGSFSFEQTNCHCALSDKVAREIFAPTERALTALKISPEALRKKHVAIIGAGGLGCPLAINLAALNVKLTIVDGDIISASNLARQYAYRGQDQGHNKALVLEQFIADRYGNASVSSRADFVDEKSILELVRSHDLILDASDDPALKNLLKRLAYRDGFALVSSSVHQQDGEVMVFAPNAAGCLLCGDRQQHAATVSCSRIGVLTHVCQMVAAVATHHALRVLDGSKQASSTMTIVDPALGQRTFRIDADPHCINCGNGAHLKPLVQISRHAS